MDSQQLTQESKEGQIDKGDVIWHFTTQEALPKILLGKDGLLAGHTSFMDDPEDCALRNKLWASIVDFVKDKEKPENKWACDALKRRIEAGAIYPIFTASFTNTIESLAMWKTRTSNGGFSIGFRRHDLIEDMRSKTEGMLIEECDYDTYEEHAQKLKKLQTDIERTKSGGDNSIVIAELEKRCRELVACKRKGFEYEHEIRAVFSFDAFPPAERLRFMAGRPFVTIPLEKPLGSYVAKIAVSPFGNVRQSLVIAHLVATALGKEVDIVEEIDCSVRAIAPEPEQFN